jgi:membrane protein implicated in regulation of membrane protease activity
MNTKILKGLFQAILGTVSAYLIINPINWALVLIAAIGAIVVYIGQRYFKELQSTSTKYSLDFINWFSGLLIAIGNAVISGAATFILNGKINWTLLGGAALSTFIAYISGTFVEGQKK